ncbi:hypothetical protein ScFU6_21350 [Streptococcus canis]|nr:hypothetical protein ScFU6_21350 [Streptococcus canis]
MIRISLTKKTKSNADYRSSVITQGAANALTRHRAPVSKNNVIHKSKAAKL